MKLVPANARVPRTNRAVRAQTGFAIAEMEPALGKAGGVPEQAGHRVPDTIRIFEALPQHHVAAALTVHRPRLRELREPVPKSMRGRERAGMQLRIAAGQPAHIAVRRRRLVRERRKGRDLRTRFAPACEQVRVYEGEGRVRRDRDALARRRQRCRSAGCDMSDRGSACARGVKVEIALGHVGQAIEPPRQIAMLGCLDEAQVPLRQHDIVRPRQRADDGDIQSRYRINDHAPMAVAADAIEHDACDADAGIVRHEPTQHGGCGLRLRGHVEHQQNR